MTTRQPIPRRASRTVEQYPQQAARQPKQQPYSSPVQEEDNGESDEYYRPRSHTSVIRYTTPRGEQVIERGNKRIVVHQGPPPGRRRIPWLTFVGIGMIVALLLVLASSWLSAWWTDHQNYATYGFPRTYQTDAVVYSTDSLDHPSHYIFMNLSGTILIIELPGGDSSHAKIYKGPTLYADKADLIPVTGEFKQINGKEEMIVHIGDQEIIYVNNGHEFVPQK